MAPCTIAVVKAKPDLHGREVLIPEALAVTRLMDSKEAKITAKDGARYRGNRVHTRDSYSRLSAKLMYFSVVVMR